MRMNGSPKNTLALLPPLAGTAGRGSLASRGLLGPVAQGGAGGWAGVPGLCLMSLHGVGTV